MILPVVKYGSPVLRQKGAQIESISPEIKQLIAVVLRHRLEHIGDELFDFWRNAFNLGALLAEDGGAVFDDG